jgi:NAD(P)-dependent dehydrogenase (short-subunit alcohol dehydrogenase family)
VRLRGKSAVETGAASGIGKAVVAAFLREGAHLIAADRDFPGAASGADEGAQNVCIDVSKEGDWERLGERIGCLDVLVACAGLSEAKAIVETSLED